MTGSHSFRRPSSTFGSRTDVGCIRDHNEDSLVVAPPLFAVADGMGGHAAGEVASEIAIETLSQKAPRYLDAEGLGKAVEAANQEVIEAAADGRGREGMGTTMTAALLEGERLAIAQVGDSRAYLLHHGVLQQLTRDHSLMADMIEAGQLTPEEAKEHPNRSVITRALGTNPGTKPDLYEINVEAGDRLLLCSDGLSGMIDDTQIERIMVKTVDPQRCASVLVNEANAAGGYDNITVIVADITGFAEVHRRKMAFRTKISIGVVATLLAALLVGAVCVFNWWSNTAAFLSEENGKVAVYSGIPGDFLGVKFNHLDHVTDINVDSLSPTVAERLKSDRGVAVDSLDEANKLADTYAQEVAEAAAAAETPSKATKEQA